MEKPDAFKSVKKAINEFQTNKTSSYEKYCDYLLYYSTHAVEILKFNMLNTNRRWNFKKYVKKQQVVYNLLS